MKLLLTLLISLCLMGCVDPIIITKIKYHEVIQPPAPAPLSLQIPYFYVVSDANNKEFQEKIRKENNGVFFALTPGDYELLAGNIQEFRRYILESKAQVKYYQDLLRADQSKTDE